MIFETAFKRLLFLPELLQFGEKKPRPPKPKGIFSHLMGGEGAEYFEEGKTPGGQNDPGPENGGKYDARGCRKLWMIAPGEVQDAFTLYEKQLILTDDGAVIKKNSFYTLPMLKYSGAPSFLFGRVTVSMPTDGYLQDVQEVELAFPQAGGKPERVVVEPHNVDTQNQIQSYRIRMKFYGTEDDRADFSRHERKFAEVGFAFDFSDNFTELLELDPLERESLPWFHVIGSRWFSAVPHSWQEDVRKKLNWLCAQETLILNYHPSHAPADVNNLNDELDYTYRLSDFYLSDLKKPEQIIYMVKTIFNKIFMDPASKTALLSNSQNRVK